MGKFRGLISNHSETRDDSKEEILKSHYYKTSQKKAMEAVKQVIGQMDGFEITSSSDDRGEMSVKGKKSFIVITVIGVRPYETSIDFSVTTESILPMDFGYSSKLITKFYEKLDSTLPYIRTGSK
jgi:hypothetical protein